MAAFSGPEIANSGLVFYYDMGNIQKSWRGAPTTNLKTNGDFSNGVTGYSAYVSSTPTVVAVSDFPGSGGLPKTVLQCTSAASIGGGGNFGGMSFANPTLSTGTTYTFSFWARAIGTATLATVYSNQNGSGDNSNFFFTKTISDQWAFYSNTVSSLDLMKNTWYIWVNSANRVWQYADIQIEQQSFATPFVNSTRTNTQALLDLTGINTVTANNLVYNSDRTFEFDGINDYASFNYTQPNPNNFTVEAWIYHTAHSTNTNIGHQIVIPYSNYNGWIFSLRGTTSLLQLRHHNFNISNTAYNLVYNSGLALNTWYHVAATDNGTTATLYVNGLSVATGASSTSTTNGTMTCYVGSWISGTDPAYSFSGKIPVVKIYHRALSAPEIRQSFESLRDRFNI